VSGISLYYYYFLRANLLKLPLIRLVKRLSRKSHHVDEKQPEKENTVAPASAYRIFPQQSKAAMISDQRVPYCTVHVTSFSSVSQNNSTATNVPKARVSSLPASLPSAWLPAADDLITARSAAINPQLISCHTSFDSEKFRGKTK
jgi:hypothetical protein